MGKKSIMLGRLDAKAFTLIELLVVVLIIGILATVALPQYQKAVVKSRVKSYMPLLKDITRAQEIYYQANGIYSRSLEDLAISLPSSCAVISNSTNGAYCGKDVYLNNGLAGTEATGILHMMYCPGYNQSWSPCEQHTDFIVRSYYQYSTSYPDLAGQIICEGFNAKGRKFCRKW